MVTLEKQLAKIKKADITIEDHGFLTIMLMFEGEGWGCGYGGFVYRQGAKHRDPDDPYEGYDGAFAITVHKILKAFDVYHWDKLEGQMAWCWTEGWGGGIDRIQPVRFSGKEAPIIDLRLVFEKGREAS